MMDNNFKQFIKRAREINLTDAEKSAAKRSVLNFISQNPVRPGVQPRLGYGSNIFLTKLSFVPSMAILLIFTIMVGGGVAVGAEKAMPGDVLYPVKIGVNEEVQGWLKVSEESKANWEIERAQRRLEEAEELADEGSLNAEASENIEANFEAHAERVRERVEKFRNKENFNAAASVSLNFETALKAHDRILSKLAQKKGNVEIQVKPLREKIRSEVRESAQNRKQIDVQFRGRAESSVETDDDEGEDIDSEIELRGDLDIELEL